MKSVTCELCGGNELIKDDGLFVCQHCGTKYTAEEARKLIIDGPVTVEGIAGADNLLKRAKEFERQRDIDRAEEYFNRVLDLDPDNSEAKAAVARLEKTVTTPNLFIEFAPATSGMTLENVFVDDSLIFNIKAGQTKQYTLQCGTHRIGTGTFKCKNPYVVYIRTRRTRYRMLITAGSFKTSFQVFEC